MDTKEVASKKPESPVNPRFDLVRKTSQEALRPQNPGNTMDTKEAIPERPEGPVNPRKMVETLKKIAINRMKELQQEAASTKKHLQIITQTIGSQQKSMESEETSHAQGKRIEIHPDLEYLLKEEKRLLQKLEQRKNEYNNIPLQTAHQAEESSQPFNVNRPSGFADNMQKPHIQRKLAEIHTLKDSQYEKIKEYETLSIIKRIAPDTHHKEIQEKQLLAQAQIEVMGSKILTTQKDLEALTSNIPQEHRQQALQGNDAQAQVFLHLWDAQINLYEARQQLTTTSSHVEKLEKNQQKMKDDHEKHASQLAIQPEESTYGKYTKISILRGELHTKVRALKSDLVSYENAIRKLEAQKKACTQSFHNIQITRDHIDTTSNAGAQIDRQAMREELTHIQEETQTTHDLLHEASEYCHNKSVDIKQQLEMLVTREIPKINHRFELLKKQLGPNELLFFSNRSDYDSEKANHQSLSSDTRNGCVPSSIMTLLSDYFPDRQFNVEEVADAVKVTNLIGGANMKKVPSALKKLGVPEDYHCIDISSRESSTAPLEKVLQDGPVLVRIQNEILGNHALVVDKIGPDSTTPNSPTKYVYIRDAIGGQDGKGVSYKVPIDDFQAVWNPREVVVKTKSINSRLHPREYSIIGYPN